jgi:hypothetical protein
MSEGVDKIQNRRRMLTGVLRYAALGVSGMLGVGIYGKRRRLLREGECLNDGLCKDCSVFDECGHPRALSAKKVLKRMSSGKK